MNKNIASYGVQILEELYKKYPKHPDIYNKLINTYISTNQYDKALNLIHKLPKYRIDNSTTAFRIWQAYINNNIEEEKKYFHNFFGKNFKLLSNQKTILYINYFSGGLGNQLYYLAFANYLKNLGHSVKLLANQTNFDGDTLNPHQRNIIFDLPRKLDFELHFENDKTIQKLNLLRESHIIGIYNEPKGEFAYFHEVPKQIISNFNTIIFRGYFQSHQYLQSSFIPQLQNVIFNTLQEQGIRNYNINNHDVAVHIRRGDFLQYQLYEFIDISFYLKGLKHFNNIQRVFIFSDDFKSIQKEIKILSHQYQVICVKNQTVLEDMYLLMQFSKYVLGNSTFAWWGALLSYHNNPQVIVPKYPWNFSYKQINKTSQYPSTWIQLDNKPASIAILYIATGRYTIFWDTFYQSAENFLLPNHKKHYFVFTDTDEILIGEKKNVTKIYQKHLGWPYDTLMRFDFFLKIKEQLMNFDYTFFFNANVKFVDKISTMDILPLNNQENLIVTLHPGFYNKTKDKFTYDRNPKSLAYISENNGQHYFAGGLNGGKVKNYLDMCEKLNHNIKIDLEKNVIALWYDESHLNRYMVNRTDLKILDISYLYPEGWKLPVKPKIILQDKSHSRFGGHNYLRQTLM